MDISKIIDKGETMQNIREYFMKEKPGVIEKIEKERMKRILIVIRIISKKIWGEGEKRKKFFKVKIDLMKQKESKGIRKK